MKTAVLGKASPLAVSAVGLGCMGMVSAYPPIPEKKDMVRFAREAFEKGETFFDTAEVYGPYTSEEILGEALADVRDQVQIATKFGFDIQNGVSVGLDSRPETIRKAVDGSLRRLKTDHIDLLYQHRADPGVPVEAVAETVSRLMEEGKVLHWGMSEVSVRTIRKAHALLPLTAVQNEYSLWYRDVENILLPVLEELGIGLVCFARWGAATWPAASSRQISPHRMCAAGCLVSPMSRPCAPIRDCWTFCRGRQRKRAAPWRSWRLPGSCPAARGSSRSREQQSCAGWWKT